MTIKPPPLSGVVRRQRPSAMFIDRRAALTCAILGAIVACGKPANDEPAPEPAVAPAPTVTLDQPGDPENEDTDTEVDEPSEDIARTETAPVRPAPKPDAPHSMYPALGPNQAFVIDFTKHSVGHGWYIANHDVPGAQWKNDFRADNVSFTPDGMVITITEKPDPEPGQWPWNSGEVSTHATFHYGYYEVEMKIARGSGLVTAMFTFTGSYYGTVHDEVDLEFVGTRTDDVEFNVFRAGRSRGSKRHQLPFDASEGFHTYAFDWQPDYVHWYVDGERVHSLTNPNHVPRVPSKIMMNMWAGNIEAWHGPATFASGTNAKFRCLSFSPGTDRSHTCSARPQ